jgi:toluene monooxygenase system ferredoxin subunit
VAFVRVCSVGEIWEGEMEAFEVGNRQVLVINVGGELRAYQGICPHQSVSLVEGKLEGCVLTCRAHLWQFDARTGAGINPAKARLERFPIRIAGNDVLIGEPGTDG